MTALSLTGAAFFVDAKRPRSLQKVAGASDLGVCMRRAGYIMHGTPPSDPKEPGMPAILGTWIHKGALDALEAAYGIFQEVLTEHPSGLLRGHADALWLHHEAGEPLVDAGLDASMPVATYDVCVLEDLKTKADDRMIDSVRKYGPPDDHLRQAYEYVWLIMTFGTKVSRYGPRAKQKALASLGPIKIDKVRLRYLARDRGVEYVWEEDVDQERVDQAQERFEYVRASNDPSELPREQRGPGLSIECDSCPFVTECWGSKEPDPDGVWPQHIRVLEGETTYEEQVENYLSGMNLEKIGKGLKEDAKAVLSGVPGARQEKVQIGEAGVLGYTGGNPVGDVEDVDQMRELLQLAEVPIPMKDGGRTRVSISVTPIKTAKPKTKASKS